MSYPQVLLPNPSRKQITCDLSGHYLIRQTKTANPEDLRDPHTQNIKDEHICDPTAHLVDLSTSLLGVFTPDHNKIQLIGARKSHFGDYCAPNELVDPVPVESEDYQVNNGCGFIIIPINRIDGQKVKFKRNDEDFEAQCRVVHTSARWNYWHYSIRWQAPDDYLHDDEQWEKTKKRGWARNLLATARSFISTHADTEMPNYTAIDSTCFEMHEAIAPNVDNPTE